MKKFDFNVPLLAADSKPVLLKDNKPTTLGQQLAGVLGTMPAKGTDAIRFWTWAMSLGKDLPIHLETADMTLLRDTIDNSESMTVLLKAQLLNHFDEQAKQEDVEL